MRRSAEAGWAEPARHPGTTWALVLLAHLALWLAWQSGLRSLPVAVLPPAWTPAWVWLRPPAVPAPPEPAARPTPASPAEPRRRSPASPDLPPTQASARPAAAPGPADPAPPQPGAQPAADAPPAAPGTGTAPHGSLRLLDSEASRAALRELARQPLLSERAAAATGLPLRSGAQRMAEAASAAGKGDCNKGEFAGGGAGLLSLPFWAAAAARGDCAR